MKSTRFFTLLSFILIFTCRLISQHTLVLYPLADVHYLSQTGGQGNKTALKFNISSLPSGIKLKNAILDVHVKSVQNNWDGDLNFYNINNQSWNESITSDSLDSYLKTDSSFQTSGFALAPGLSSSINLSEIVYRDYDFGNAFCSIMLHDPDDTTHLNNSGILVKNLDSLVCGDSDQNATFSFWASESNDPNLQPQLTITYCYPTDTFLTFTVCDSLVINNEVLDTSGLYAQILVNAENCDSIVWIDLTVLYSVVDTITASACDSIVFGNISYYNTGIYQQHYTGSNTCDSSFILNFTINKSSSDTIQQTVCNFILINNKLYSESGIYHQFLINSLGCDSILVIELIVHYSSTETITQTACDSIIINNQKYTSSNTYIQVLSNSENCDSVLVLELTINQSSSDTIKQTACDSIIVNNEVYKTTGTYFQLFTNTENCDSIIVLELTINHSTNETLLLTTCDSAIINNQTFKATGTYTQLLSNTNNCDSTLRIELTINQSSRDTIQLTACDSAVINNQTFKSSGTYTQILSNTNNCDSTLQIELIIHQSSRDTIQLTACDSVIINNQTFKSSGTYTQSFTNANSCDSTLIIELTINQSSSNTIQLTSCDTIVINNQTYSESGMYIQFLSNSENCDSILIIKLSVIDIDTSISQNGINLTANQSAASYQWVDCTTGLPIANETNQNFTATANGLYAVIISSNTCIDTSSCYQITLVSTHSTQIENTITLFPNPTYGYLSILSKENLKDATIRILNTNGVIQQIWTQQNGKQFSYDISQLTSGILFVEIQNNVSVKRIKLLKI
ncbi:MAG: T9SS type A sorting domain-containing protein [Saprospiraceae bacterium]